MAPDLLEAIKITESLVEYLNKNGKTMLHTNETLKVIIHLCEQIGCVKLIESQKAQKILFILIA